MQATASSVSAVADIVRYMTTAGILTACGLLYRLDRRVAVMRVTLIGENGENGIRGDVKALRSRVHDLASDVQAVETKVAVHEQRLSSGGI